jgi:hypothetical protein
MQHSVRLPARLPKTVAYLCSGYLLLAFASDSVADDCEFSKTQMNTYLTQCAGVDRCQLKERYQQIVVQQCGPSEKAAPAAQADSGSQQSSASNNSSPGSTLSYTPSTSTSGEKPADRDDYTGQSCVFFTKPAVEVKDGVVRHNTYANDAMVCYKDALYKCVGGKWQRQRDCPGSIGYKRLQAEVVEGSDN